MRILVVVQAYPNSSRPDISSFVHTRNVYYQTQGSEVQVLSFSARSSYKWENINVLTRSHFTAEMIEKFDVILCHSPNLRNHFIWLWSHRTKFKKIIFFCHGHEFLNYQKFYQTTYFFQRTLFGRAKAGFKYIYDEIKIAIWGRFFRKQKQFNIALIFVSDWIYKAASKSLNCSFEKLGYKTAVISNPVHPTFIQNKYEFSDSKEADFVTIRSFDDPKYAIDVVVELANRMPSKTFHVYGMGQFFEYVQPPQNMKISAGLFNASELHKILNKYRFVLLPTRQDTQGVLMCEAACFGAPTIVSDISICHEMVGEFPNVQFLSNADPALPPGYSVMKEPTEVQRCKFDFNNTVDKEYRFVTREVLERSQV